MTHKLLTAYDYVTDQEKPQPTPKAAAAPSNGTGSTYGQTALANEMAAVRNAAQGGRNEALNKAAFALGQLVAGSELDEAMVEAALLEAALDVGLTEGEARRTIESGLGSGEALPRTAPPSTYTNGNGHYNGFGPAPDLLDDTQPGNGLPRIQVNNRQLRDVRAEALMALQRANEASPAHPLIYVRGGRLVRVARDERNIHAVQLLDTPELTGILADTADWLRVGKDSQTHVSPPGDLVRDVLALSEWTELPALSGVVASPTFGDSGVLHDTAGYSAHTQLYYAGYVEPEHMALDQAKRLILDELLVDFPFQDDASRAHAIAMMLLPFVRPMIRGATPLHLVDSPTPGTGKGLLIDVCAYPSTGQWLPSMAAGENDDEWRKRLTAVLLRGDTHVHIDNIAKPLDSGSLASALSQDSWSDRVLSKSYVINLLIRQVWCGNGNNVALSDEIARRTVWMRLDANSEKPWQRDQFKHRNLRGWVAEHRPALIGACLAMIQAWVDAGRPNGDIAKGSFNEWARVMGGILKVAGISGFLANDDQLYTGKTETSAMAEFVQAWQTRYGENRVESGELFKLASIPDQPDALTGSEWLGLLDDHLAPNSERGRRRAFGRLLKGYEDKVVAGCKIRCEGRSHGSMRWRLIVLEGGAESTVEEYGL